MVLRNHVFAKPNPVLQKHKTRGIDLFFPGGYYCAMKYASYDGFNTLPVAGGLTVSNTKTQRNSAKPNFVRHISHQPLYTPHENRVKYTTVKYLFLCLPDTQNIFPFPGITAGFRPETGLAHNFPHAPGKRQNGKAVLWRKK
jgi:hypothetical protein